MKITVRTLTYSCPPVLVKNMIDLPVEGNILDLVWLAGYLEGVGTFSHQRYYRQVKTGPNAGLWSCHTRPSLVCSSIDRQTIERVAKLLNSPVTGPYLPPRRPNSIQAKQPRWQCFIAGGRARAVMVALLPWVGPRRREQITRLLYVVCTEVTFHATRPPHQRNHSK